MVKAKGGIYIIPYSCTWLSVLREAQMSQQQTGVRIHLQVITVKFSNRKINEYNNKVNRQTHTPIQIPKKHYQHMQCYHTPTLSPICMWYQVFRDIRGM